MSDLFKMLDGYNHAVYKEGKGHIFVLTEKVMALCFFSLKFVSCVEPCIDRVVRNRQNSVIIFSPLHFHLETKDKRAINTKNQST